MIENPYRLARDIRGIGFKSADAIIGEGEVVATHFWASSSGANASTRATRPRARDRSTPRKKKGEVFGEAPNVAARVQAAAEPGTVLITASVQRQTAGLFVVEDKGAHDLKGVPAPVALYRIVRASGGGRRGVARPLLARYR